jgi:phosphonate transport system substrate-binding protein
MKILGIALIALSIFLPSASLFAADSFIIGVAPHTSARVIMAMYQPLRTYLEKSLGMPVEVVTAPDFTEFARRAIASEYDLAITTGHQARLFQTDAGYIPLLTYKADFKAVALVLKEGQIHAPTDLKGKKALGLSVSSLVTLWGSHWLKNNGLGEIPVRYVSASDSVAQLIVAGDSDVGFLSLANFQKLPPAVQAQLRILDESPAMAGRVYMLNSRCSAREKEIDAALWDFAGTADALLYFEANQLEGYRKLGPKELEAMDPYAAEVGQALQRGEK